MRGVPLGLHGRVLPRPRAVGELPAGQEVRDLRPRIQKRAGQEPLRLHAKYLVIVALFSKRGSYDGEPKSVGSG